MFGNSRKKDIVSIYIQREDQMYTYEVDKRRYMYTALNIKKVVNILVPEKIQNMPPKAFSEPESIGSFFLFYYSCKCNRGWHTVEKSQSEEYAPSFLLSIVYTSQTTARKIIASLPMSPSAADSNDKWTTVVINKEPQG